SSDGASSGVLHVTPPFPLGGAGAPSAAASLLTWLLMFQLPRRGVSPPSPPGSVATPASMPRSPTPTPSPTPRPSASLPRAPPSPVAPAPPPPQRFGFRFRRRDAGAQLARSHAPLLLAARLALHVLPQLASAREQRVALAREPAPQVLHLVARGRRGGAV